MSEFISGKFLYILPAPGGSLKNGDLKCNSDADAWLASLAAAAKASEDWRATLKRWLDTLACTNAFDHETDLKMMERIGAWLGEDS